MTIKCLKDNKFYKYEMLQDFSLILSGCLRKDEVQLQNLCSILKNDNWFEKLEKDFNVKITEKKGFKELESLIGLVGAKRKILQIVRGTQKTQKNIRK